MTRLLVLLALAAGGCVNKPPPKNQVPADTAADLPQRTYAVAGRASALLDDEAAFAHLAAAVRRDLESDIAKYEIRDKAVAVQYHMTLAYLAAMDGRAREARGHLARARKREETQSVRLTSGLVVDALIEARLAGGDRRAAFRRFFELAVAALPLADVVQFLKEEKFRAELRSPAYVEGRARALVDPVVHERRISLDGAMLLVFLRFSARELVPVSGDIAAVCGAALAKAAGSPKPDIWAAREVDLTGATGLTPVAIAVWDTGVDTSLYPGQLSVNTAEVAGNGVDDDKNGWVDDVHGIAYDIQGARSQGDLATLVGPADHTERARAALAGFAAMLANLDTPEATAVRRQIAGLAPEAIGPFFDDLAQAAFYSHGTHSAGIALAKNPAARLVSARIEADWRGVPLEPPTLELARRRAQQFKDTVAYLAARGVRVVSLGWGWSADDLYSQLEMKGVGKSPTVRRLLAQRIHDIMAAGLKEAMASAPDMLFISAIGHRDRGTEVVDAAPSSFDLANLLVVGAVDHAGDLATFTSFAPARVHASGIELESFVPGGQRVKWSGAGVAAPQVANLAGKLLAVRPDLTTAHLRAAILDGADEKVLASGRRIRLLNPRRSFEAVGRK